MAPHNPDFVKNRLQTFDRSFWVVVSQPVTDVFI